MIITCSQCQAKFKVAPEQIKETGSKVRCSNCQYVFTVFRPRFPDDLETPGRPLPSTSSSILDDYLNSAAGQGRPEDYGLDDLLGDRPAPRPDGLDSAGGYEDPEDGLDEFGEDFGDDEGPHLDSAGDRSASIRERRDRRRQLYSDLGQEILPPQDDQDFDEDGLVGEDGRPSLRRSARARGGEDYDQEYDDQPYDDQPYDDQPYDDQPYDEHPSEQDDFYDAGDGREADDNDYGYQSTRLARQVSDLGLDADPVDPDKFIDDAAVSGRSYGGDQEAPTIRAAVTKTQGGNAAVKLFVGLGLLIMILGAALYFAVGRPAPTALSDGQETPETTVAGDDPAGPGDQTGTEGITFTRGNQKHYFRDNRQAGNLLIITGMVRNSFPDSRNFIRLRGHLLSSDGRSLAERYVYAGNIISEEDLKTLPMNEILSRLSIKGGQDRRNMNIEPGQEIPFMLVFDKLPDGMAEYRIDPVGSSPSN